LVDIGLVYVGHIWTVINVVLNGIVVSVYVAAVTRTIFILVFLLRVVGIGAVIFVVNNSIPVIVVEYLCLTFKINADLSCFAIFCAGAFSARWVTDRLFKPYTTSTCEYRYESNGCEISVHVYF
jgi:hypothetical protein